MTADWQSRRASPARVLVACTLAEYIENPVLQQHLRADCPVVDRFKCTLGGGDIVVCEVRQGETPQ